MADDTKEPRVRIEDLPQPEAEVSAEEAKEVRGGLLPAVQPPGDDELTARNAGGGQLSLTNEGDPPPH